VRTLHSALLKPHETFRSTKVQADSVSANDALRSGYWIFAGAEDVKITTEL
jgi:hypothetical protein